jgi:P4 family phage/plasmid primase-like protien
LSQTDLATAAHAYAARGWRVIPLHRVGPDGRTCSCRQGGNCTSKGKHPKDNEWQKAPRPSGPDIEDTWRVERPPNIGIATGEESGVWVLDIDPKGGGMESMARLVSEHGKLPTTYVAETGSKGYHYYFNLPDFVVKNDQSGHVAPGIDVRGKGGQVVAAPSHTDKGDYRVVQDAPVADAPQWLLEMVRKTEHDVADVTAEDLPKPEDLDEQTWKRLSAYAERAIESELTRLDACKAAATPNPNDYRGAPWNHTTFEVACSLLEFANSPWCAYSAGHARADLLARAPRDAEFDGHIILKCFESARERIGNKARPMPEDRTQEPDPMFGGPDVRNPSEGEGEQPGPVVRRTRVFFGGEQGTTPLYAEMARGVMELGPIGWGQDNDFWSYSDGFWKPDHYVVQHRLVDLLKNAYRTSHRSNTIDVVQRHAQRITGDPLESMMNFRNGMLDWREGTLVDHDPSYGSTVQLNTEWIPGEGCPRFEAFLNDIMHSDYVALAWEMLGYLMLSGNPHQVAFLFYGSGGNGKGTLLDLIGRLLGQSNIATESLDDLNGNRFRSAQLFGKIANIAGDIDATYQEHTAMFKSITGEDMITGEHKNLPPFRFQSWAVPVFSANKFPGSADVTEGYLRRWIILHFHKRISAKQIILRSELMAAFEAEMPGIAYKAVEALRTLMERGHFQPEGEAVKGGEEFAMSIDQVRQWLAKGEVTGGPGVETPLTTLYASYKDWSARAGHKAPLRETEFSHRLDSLGYPAERIAGMDYHKEISVPVVAARTPAEFDF